MTHPYRHDGAGQFALWRFLTFNVGRTGTVVAGYVIGATRIRLVGGRPGSPVRRAVASG
jgi:hypothetical protein